MKKDIYSVYQGNGHMNSWDILGFLTWFITRMLTDFKKCFVCFVVEIEPRALCVLDKCSPIAVFPVLLNSKTISLLLYVCGGCAAIVHTCGGQLRGVVN